MTNVDPRVEGVRSVLVRLRTRSGLNAERLHLTEVGTGPLFELPLVQRHARSTGVEPATAVVCVVRELAAQLRPTDSLIVDAALALGLLRETALDAAGTDLLYGPDLGHRREQLVTAWSQLHELKGAVDVPPAPTVRALRANLELQALGKLAELCVSGSTRHGASPAGETPDRVAVVGAAVVDHVYVVDHLPAPGTSVQASSYVEHPGGKALNQAVACARLGLEVDLVVALGGDDASEAIVQYVEREGVRTHQIKRVASAHTPVTAVIVDHTGRSAIIGWKDETDLHLASADFEDDALRAAIESAAAVLVTFETTIDAVRKVITLARHNRPVLVVHPSPPFETPQLLYEYLSGADYVVGSPWELRRLLPEAGEDISVEQLANQLLLLGVSAVCIVENFGCQLRSSRQNLDVPPLPIALEDTPGARDAFSAALTYRILHSDGQLTHDDLSYAVAAMAATPSFGRISSSMPSTEEIGHVLAVSPGFEKK